MANATGSFEVVINCSGRATGKMRNETRIEIVEPFRESHELASDEGAFHGGDGTAPPPLIHFVGGFVTCLMTQIRAFAKRLRVELDSLSVEGNFAWKGITESGKPYRAEPVGIRLDIEIESRSGQEELLALIKAAKEGCFVEAIISDRMPVAHRLKTQAGWVDC